jgi:hypothetical protein
MSQLRVVMPNVCMESTPQGAACGITVDHYRERSTGPCFPIAVLRCRTHHVGFTAYPPGHVPYGRVAVVQLSPSGQEVLSDLPELDAAYAGTVFEAALDASSRHQWWRVCPGGSNRWWGSQWRHVAVAVRVCGMAPGFDGPTMDGFASILGVDALLLREAAAAIAAHRGYASRGRAVRAVLTRVGSGSNALRRLLVSGHRAQRWGQPWVWDRGAARLVALPFRYVGTGPARTPL